MICAGPARRVPIFRPALDLLNAPKSALTDALGEPQGSEPLAGFLACPLVSAALIAQGAQLELDGGECVRPETRLLEDGALDLDGLDGAPRAAALLIPLTTDASALIGGDDHAVAVRISEDADCSVVIAGAAPYPIRARQTESALRGRKLGEELIELASETLRGEAQPFGVGDLTDRADLDRLVIAFIQACECARARLVCPTRPFSR